LKDGDVIELQFVTAVSQDGAVAKRNLSNVKTGINDVCWAEREGLSKTGHAYLGFGENVLERNSSIFRSLLV